MARARHKKKSMKGKFLVILLLLLAILAFSWYFLFPKEMKEQVKKVAKIEPSLKIVDENSKKRPIAVMIDNSDAARDHHAGLQDAFITYEMITEGGISRIMALYKDKDVDLIGPVRSSRHYFLDYAMENDAIYAHYGWSDRARSDIESLGIDNLNGITNAQNTYWRDDAFYAPHNVYTSTKDILDTATEKDYELKTEQGLLLPYSAKNVSLEQEENKLVANRIAIPYSYYHETDYQYNPDTKEYYRSMNGSPHTDYQTKEQYHVKNIIVIKVNNYSFDDYGRQDLENIGSGDGYYITNGYAIPITWEKTSRSSKTIYKKVTGEEIQVNDGNTAIQIQPISQELTITE